MVCALVAARSLGAPQLEASGHKPLQPGDEVITAAAGFPTTVNPIIQNGWFPHLVDVDVDVDVRTLNVDAEVIINACTPKTRAISLAYTRGNPFPADLLEAFCRQERIYLLEDCCDAFCATVGGRPVGSFGEFATLSFYPAHRITMGEGSAVLSRNAHLRKVAASMRD